MKKNKLLAISIIGILLTTTVVYAASELIAKYVVYDNTKTKLISTNVQDAIEELNNILE